MFLYWVSSIHKLLLFSIASGSILFLDTYCIILVKLLLILHSTLGLTLLRSRHYLEMHSNLMSLPLKLVLLGLFREVGH
jgi:hypothetical protein